MPIIEIECSGCHKIYKVDDAKIPNKVVRSKCKKCGNIISIDNTPPKTQLDEATPDIVKKCPKCNSKNPISSKDCQKCGVIFSKLESPAKKATPDPKKSENNPEVFFHNKLDKILFNKYLKPIIYGLLLIHSAGFIFATLAGVSGYLEGHTELYVVFGCAIAGWSFTQMYYSLLKRKKKFFIISAPVVVLVLLGFTFLSSPIYTDDTSVIAAPTMIRGRMDTKMYDDAKEIIVDNYQKVTDNPELFKFWNRYVDACEAGLCLGSDKFTINLAKKDNQQTAYAVAKDSIKEILKSPSTAKFEALKDLSSQEIAGETYILNFYVDATNSFGGTMRKDCVVYVQNVGRGNWYLLSRSID